MPVTAQLYRHHQPAVPVEAGRIAELLKSDDDHVLWVDIQAPDADDQRLMERLFGFHPLAIEDVYNQKQRPKADEFADHLFIILNPINTPDDELLFRELDVFVGPNYLLTAHIEAEPVIAQARARIDPTRLPFEMSSSYLLYMLMDTVVDGYMPVLEQIEHTLDAMGERLLQRPDAAMLNECYRLKTTLSEMWWTILPQNDIVNALSKHPHVFTEKHSHYHLRDVGDHLTRVTNLIAASRDNINGLINLYMSAVSNQVNIAVTRLTAFTIISGIFAVITGFYGMNFERTWPPFQAEWGVLYVVGLLIFMAALLLLIMRWLGWVR